MLAKCIFNALCQLIKPTISFDRRGGWVDFRIRTLATACLHCRLTAKRSSARPTGLRIAIAKQALVSSTLYPILYLVPLPPWAAEIADLGRDPDPGRKLSVLLVGKFDRSKSKKRTNWRNYPLNWRKYPLNWRNYYPPWRKHPPKKIGVTTPSKNGPTGGVVTPI